MSKKPFDELSAFDLIDLNAFDQVDLSPEDKVLLSKELKGLIREELDKAILNIPVGQIITDVLKKALPPKENTPDWADKIEKAKEELKNEIQKTKEEKEKIIQALKEKYAALRNEFLNQPRYEFGGFAPPSTAGHSGQFLTNNGAGGFSWAAAGGVSSVSNSDGTLTISPTTGTVVASLALSHANIWTGKQTFNTTAPTFGTISPGSVLFVNSLAVLSEDNANFFWDYVNKSLAIGPTGASANARLTLSNGSFSPGTVSSITATEGASGISNYIVGDTVTYRIYAYLVVRGFRVYSSTYAESSPLVFTNSFEEANISWGATAGTGYIIRRNYNLDNYATYYDTGTTATTFDDFNDSWISGTPKVTPTTSTAVNYFEYGNGTTGYTIFNANSALSFNNATFLADSAENTIPALICSKDNAGLGTGNDIEFGRCGLVVHNSNSSSQTMVAFTTGNLDSPTVLGGLRVDHNGSYSWEALSTAGHYFWVGGIGTEHIAAFFSINGNGTGYGLTVGSSTAPTGATVLDVYGTSNFRGNMSLGSNALTVGAVTATNITDSALTAGRVTFAGTSGILADDADMTFSVDTLTVTKIAATTFTGNITLSTKNIVTDTTTGTQFGTASTQKIGFLGATPVAVQTATSDLGSVLGTFGLRSNGSAYPITTSGAVVLTASSGGSVDGRIWNDTTQKAFAAYESGIKQMLSGCIFTQTADATVTNTVTETSILGTGVGTKTLPANFFIAGKTIRIRVGGVYSTPIGVASVVVKVKYGTTVLASVTTSSLLSGASSLEFDGEALITCRTTGATGTVAIHGDIEYATGAAGTIAVDSLNNGAATATIDTTASSALDVTVTWDSATTTRIAKATISTIEVLN